MQAKAQTKYMMLTPRKARQVADEIRAKSVEEALNFLIAMRNKKKAVIIVEKTLKSAVANFAVVQPNVDTEKLFVKEVFVDSGPSYKRIRARAQGRAMRRLKRTSHLTIVISD
ncbi:MAG: 50S ribosomal protein L22 [Fibrobacterota bacterium]